MNLAQLRNEVEITVEDAGYTPQDIDRYINLALKRVADLVVIPSLKRIATVSTSTTLAYASLAGLTGGFSGRLIRVLDPNGNVIQRMYNDIALMLDEYGSLETAGDIEAVCLEGSVLWYYYIPSAVKTLTVLYSGYPTPLTTEDGEPTDIPESMQIPLLVKGAAWFIFDQIEDGIQVQKNNTKVMDWLAWDTTNPRSGISLLQQWIGRNRIHHISSQWRD